MNEIEQLKHALEQMQSLWWNNIANNAAVSDNTRIAFTQAKHLITDDLAAIEYKMTQLYPNKEIHNER